MYAIIMSNPWTKVIITSNRYSVKFEYICRNAYGIFLCITFSLWTNKILMTSCTTHQDVVIGNALECIMVILIFCYLPYLRCHRKGIRKRLILWTHVACVIYIPIQYHERRGMAHGEIARSICDDKVVVCKFSV